MSALGSVALSLTLTCAPQSAAQDVPHTLPVFQSEVASVFVDVFVTEGGRSVTGLTVRDFTLKDGGVPQPFDLIPTDEVPIRLILAFDTSASVNGAKLERLKSSARQLLARLRPQDEVGLVAFSEEVVWAAPLSSDQRNVRGAIDTLKPFGSTSVYDALFGALMLPRSASRTLVVLFSDGEDNSSWITDRKLRRLVERFNTLIYVVAARTPAYVYGFGGRSTAVPAYIRRLRDIAEVTGGSLFEVDSPERIEAAFGSIMDLMKNRYILRYDPAGDPAPGWHRLAVELKSKAGKVRGRSGYWVEKR